MPDDEVMLDFTELPEPSAAVVDKAERLVGGVVRDSRGGWTVRSGDHVYRVSVSGLCDCEWGRRHGAGCSHALAVQLSEGGSLLSDG